MFWSNEWVILEFCPAVSLYAADYIMLAIRVPCTAFGTVRFSTHGAAI
jgi:hypothetical protein